MPTSYGKEESNIRRSEDSDVELGPILFIRYSIETCMTGSILIFLRSQSNVHSV